MEIERYSTVIKWIKCTLSIPMWKMIVLSLFCTFTPEVLLAQIYLSGNISGTLTDSTYIVTDDIFVSETDDLIIEAGARLFFHEGTGLTVEGLLHADGEDGDSIYFGPLNTDQRWDGILCDGLSTPGTRISYSIVEKCTSYGIKVLGESYGIDIDNTVVRDIQEDGILLINTLPDTLINVSLINIDSIGVGCYSSGMFVSGCLFRQNYRGISLGSGGGEKRIFNSYFTQIENCAIYGYNSFEQHIDSCLFTNNVLFQSIWDKTGFIVVSG